MSRKDELLNILYTDLEAIDWNIENEHVYYNEATGDVSAIIAAILEECLIDEVKWDSDLNWIDDSLIKLCNNNALTYEFGGVIIRGKKSTTEQWTDPFYFKIDKNKQKLTDVNTNYILFQDREWDSIVYSDFIKNREIWDDEPKKWRFKLSLI